MTTRIETPEFIGKGESGAVFDQSRIYRYSLWRRWDDCEVFDMQVFIGLNPSTADESEDDPTIRRCIRFAKDAGMVGLVMMNLFAFRATDPQDMKAAADPIGPDNDEALRRVCEVAKRTICCWGTHGAHLFRGATVRRDLNHINVPLFHLGLTKGGYPKHPLYLRADTQPTEWD